MPLGHQQSMHARQEISVPEQPLPDSDTRPERSNPGQQLVRQNFRAAERSLGHPLTPRLKSSLQAITQEWEFSLEGSDLLILNGSVYVTHTGLLRLARRMHCSGIAVEAVESLCNASLRRYVLKATVYPGPDSAGFAGFSDADPSNVSALVRGAELRMAETRAVNRALRKAYGIGLCSAEELGSSFHAAGKAEEVPNCLAAGTKTNGSGRKVRDRLRQIIRQNHLDPALVKAYAVEFCGSASLRDASREQVERFVERLAERAATDRSALLCQLNSFPRPADAAVA
jgi:hypothetical protein